MSRRSGIHPTAVVGSYPEHRENIREPGKETFAPQIDPTANIGPFVTVDSGTVRPTTVGARTLMFAHSHAGHDVVIGKDSEIATGVVLGGHSEVGDRVRIGVNATILPFRKIGEGARVGAGAVVTRDVEPRTVVSGNPAKYRRAVNSDESRFNVGEGGV